MLLRQVQARPLQGHHLRALRRRGDAPEGAPRAHGPHRPGRARLAHLVLQGRAEPHRLPARHRPARAREGPLLRRLDRHARRRRGARRRTSTTSRTRSRPSPSGSTSTATSSSPRSSSGSQRRRDYFAQGQGEGLRRGRRLLGPRPDQLGRGAGAADARGRPRRWSAACSSSSRRRSRPRTRRRSASSSADRRSATTASSPRASSSRSRPPPTQIREALAPLHEELDDATGSKKGALTKHINRIVGGAARRRGARRATTPSSSRGVDAKNLEKARDLGNGLLARGARAGRAGRGRAEASASWRTTSACAPTGRSARRTSTRSSSGR